MREVSRGRPRPRMSAPKMGEYLEAGPYRREGILRDQKFGAVFKQAYYERARRAIQAGLTCRNVSQGLAQRIQRLESLPPSSAHEEDTIRCSLQAVRRFVALYPSLGLEGVSASTPSSSGVLLKIEEVSLSVSATVNLHRVGRRGAIETGALLVVMRKEKPLGERGGKAVAELVRLALVAAGHESVRPELCLALDVFHEHLSRATGRGHRIGVEIASACREIAVRWPALTASRAA